MKIRRPLSCAITVKTALLLGIVMREGWNGLDLGKALDAETASINAGMPLGMTLTKVTDQSVNISSAVGEFMVKFFVALLVVMLVCFLSMGWRVGVVVAAAVPLTLAIVFVVMAATGKNFDRITLGSLILALGLLVDDAIIAIEMMVVKMEEGYDRIKASAYAWSHTAAPMLSGTLVTADRLYAQRLCAVHRRRVHQQHVLDCRHCPDCFLGCGGGVYPVSGREDVAEHQEGRRWPCGDLQHPPLQPLPPVTDPRYRAQMAGGRHRDCALFRRDTRHGAGEEAVFPDLRPPRGDD